jgi:hypothetical protein
MQSVKIVVTGAFAAGKTSFIRAISDIDTVSTEHIVANTPERQIKQHTTVALDFGTVAIDNDIVVFLFGTPGQERFDFMWEHLSLGCIGYVVMVDSCRPDHFSETRRLMQRFAQLTGAPFVVAANKQDDPTSRPTEYIRSQLALPTTIPILPCVANNRESVRLVLLTLLQHIEQTARRAPKIAP